MAGAPRGPRVRSNREANRQTAARDTFRTPVEKIPPRLGIAEALRLRGPALPRRMTIRREIRVYLFSVDDARRLDRLLLDLNAGYTTTRREWLTRHRTGTSCTHCTCLPSGTNNGTSRPPSRAKQSAEPGEN